MVTPNTLLFGKIRFVSCYHTKIIMAHVKEPASSAVQETYDGEGGWERTELKLGGDEGDIAIRRAMRKANIDLAMQGMSVDLIESLIGVIGRVVDICPFISIIDEELEVVCVIHRG